LITSPHNVQTKLIITLRPPIKPRANTWSISA
jgi:hypothetical protein